VDDIEVEEEDYFVLPPKSLITNAVSILSLPRTISRDVYI